MTSLIVRMSCLVCLMLAASAACAQTAAEAAISRGVSLRKQGKNTEALQEFQLANSLEPSPRARAQIALAEQALGHWVRAEAGLLEALSNRQDAWIARNVEPLTAALETVRDHVASLRLEGEVPGTGVWLNGQVLGILPLPDAVRVPAGEVRVEARAQGYDSREWTLALAPRSEQTLRLELKPSHAPRAATAPPKPSAAAAPPPKPVPATPTTPQGGSGLRTAGIVSLIASGVFLAGGITAHALREFNASKYNSEWCEGDPGCEKGYKDRAETAGTLAIAGYAAAGGTLVLGIVLLLVAPSDSGDRAQALLPELAPDRFRLLWRHTF